MYIDLYIATKKKWEEIETYDTVITQQTIANCL